MSKYREFTQFLIKDKGPWETSPTDKQDKELLSGKKYTDGHSGIVIHSYYKVANYQEDNY